MKSLPTNKEHYHDEIILSAEIATKKAKERNNKSIPFIVGLIIWLVYSVIIWAGLDSNFFLE